MRRKTLNSAINDGLATQRIFTRESLELFERQPVNTIAVVEIADYRQVKERDERQLLTIATLEAERAQLRMLLKEALGQLERIFTTTKASSPEYRRLMARSDAVLAPKAVEP